MLGNIQFIGELFKKGVLRETVMKTCVERLLNARKDVDASGKLKGLKFINAEVDETNIEASGGTHCFFLISFFEKII